MNISEDLEFTSSWKHIQLFSNLYFYGHDGHPRFTKYFDFKGRKEGL